MERTALRFGTGVADMRIVRVPLDAHHPVWVADPDYSPHDHIYTRGPARSRGQGPVLRSSSPTSWVDRSIPTDRCGRPGSWKGSRATGSRWPSRCTTRWPMAGRWPRCSSAAIRRQAHDDLPSGGHRRRAHPRQHPVARGAAGRPGEDVHGRAPGLLPRAEAGPPGASRPRTSPATGRTSLTDERPGTAPFTVLNEKRGGRYRVFRYEIFSSRTSRRCHGSSAARSTRWSWGSAPRR